MTDRFRRKVRSQRGASLLLALLFLLICAMVGASILMAAAANAGKHRSNLDEHQTYLALSSAVSLLCDELNAAEYRGQYKSWKVTSTDPETEEVTITEYFKQEKGKCTYTGREEVAKVSSLLRDDFDKIFASTIRLPNGVNDESDVGVGGAFHSVTHILTLKPETGIPALDGDDVNGKEVIINLTVKDSYAIYLTAYLEDLEVYKIDAELTPNVSSKPAIETPLSYDESIKQTDPMKWKLGWITTGEEEGDDP